MPPVKIESADLLAMGAKWSGGSNLNKKDAMDFGKVFDRAVGEALAAMLGGIPIVAPTNLNALTPPLPDCVEVGGTRIIGGVRPQNFDVCYRPDGVRFAFDSKTLNDAQSIGKNWQNMVNDLATEATTVHSRFPHALVAFMVVIPAPAFTAARQRAMVETLERLARRHGVDGPPYMAEAIALVVWDPTTGAINTNIPDPASPLRLDGFSQRIYEIYSVRYKGLPPHELW